MDLVTLGVHQHCAAMTAAIIDGVCAGDQDGRGSHNSPNSWRVNNFEAQFRTLVFAHDAPFTGESTETPSHRRLAEPLPVMWSV
jgi:hypothetical protein